VVSSNCVEVVAEIEVEVEVAISNTLKHSKHTKQIILSLYILSVLMKQFLSFGNCSLCYDYSMVS
jgi:hypothetical protein